MEMKLAWIGHGLVIWYMANVSGYHKFNLKLAYLNINSITNKIDEVKEMLGKGTEEANFVFSTKSTQSLWPISSCNLSLFPTSFSPFGFLLLLGKFERHYP